MRLKDKVAIVTGGAGGIGLATCQRFLEEGAKVILADFNDNEAEKQTDILENKGYDIQFIHVDVSDQNSVKDLIEKTLKHYQRIDILINNAGVTDDSTLLKMEHAQFERVLDVNVKGVFNCAQAVIPIMIDQGKGKIINTSSVSGVYGNFGQTNYAASKAAVVGMTKTWAKEFGRKGININAIAPGFIETEMVMKIPEKVREKLKANISLQTLGKPREIANAYLYLASEESDYVHGHVLHVDGGVMM